MMAATDSSTEVVPFSRSRHDLPRSSTGSDSHADRGAERARLDSNGSSVRNRASSSGALPIARSGSSVSTISTGSIPRCDSRASSSPGNRDSIISNYEALAAGACLPELQEVSENDSDSTGGNDFLLYKEGNYFEANTSPHEAARDGMYSKPVPSFESTLTLEEDRQFICDKTYCHLEKMSIKSINTLLQSEGQNKVNSHLFSVERYKYSVCLQVRIGTENISIGIVIMKGRNDREATWPFNMIVLFRLKNLSGGEHLVKMFRCDKNGPRIKEAVSRPKSDMNVAVGFPCFISRQRLISDGFIKNNKMFLECYLFPKDAKINQDSEYPSIIR